VLDIIICLLQTQNYFPFLLSHVCSICEKVLGPKKIDLEILMQLHVLSSPEYERVGFGMSSVLSVRMCSLLLPEWLSKFYSYLVSKSSSIIGQCLVNMNIPALKIGTF
jgi:hypothetical protein